MKSTDSLPFARSGNYVRTLQRAMWLGAAVSAAIGFTYPFHDPPVWAAFWLHQAEALCFAVTSVVVRCGSERQRTAAMMVCLLVATPLVSGAWYLSGDDPLRYLTFLPLTVAVVLPEEPWAIAASSLAVLGTAAALIWGLHLPVRASYALGTGAVIGAVSVYASLRLRKLQRMLREQAELDMTRSTQALSAAAARLYFCRTAEAVLQVAADALSSEGLRSRLLRVEGDALVVVPLGGDAPEPSARALPLATLPELAGVLTARQALFKADGCPAHRWIWPGAPAQASVTVPVIVEGEPYGLLCVRSDALRSTSAALIELFATHLGAALENVAHHDRAKKRLEELTRLQAALVARERLVALGEAAAVVAHEVRNPLGAIVNATALLKKGDADRAHQGRLLEMVEEEAMSLDKLVHDLLVLARPLTPHKRAVDLVALVTRTCSLLPEAGVRARVAVLNEGEQRRTVLADPDHLQLALLNLLRNALQASPPAEPIGVRLRSDGDWHVVTVEDEGPGIAAELRERIFEPFFTTRSSGTGLGLAIVKRVVEAHEGRLEVLGRAERGTRIDVGLRAAREA